MTTDVPPSDLPPLYADLTYNAPLSPARAARLVAFATEDTPTLVLDAGCGWAGLLQAILVAPPAAHGVGVDVDERLIRRGGATAAGRGLADRLRLVAGDAAHLASEPADVVVSIGSGHIWGDDAAALAALRRLVTPGGRIIYGTGIWSRSPTSQAAAPFGGDLAVFPTLADLVDLAIGLGLRPWLIAEANQDEWDAFESGYLLGYERWLADHDGADPNAGEILRRAGEHRSEYLRGYRGVMGFAYLGLRTA